jgi:NarL family two-component system response regulator LiaR
VVRPRDRQAKGVAVAKGDVVPATKGERHPIRVALSNDYEIALLGLAQMLAQHPSEVQIVDLTTVAKMPHEADIILYDTFGRFPDDDIKLRRLISENTAKVVVYSWDDYPEEAAMRHGAAGYLHKGLNADELVAAVGAIHDGQPPPEAANHEGEPVLTWPGQVLGLSQRESEVLTFITRGLSNEEIARRSFLSINTVKSYIRNAYRKIGVESRPQAIVWGYQNGFESTDDTGL